MGNPIINNTENDWSHFHPSEGEEEIPSNSNIEIQYKNKFYSRIDQNELYLFIEDKEKKLIHKLEIIFQPKLNTKIASVVIILLIIIFSFMLYNIKHNLFILWKDFKKFKSKNMINIQ